MNTDDKIAFIAITIGLAKMLMLVKELINTDDISNYSLEYVICGIIASTLWIVYQYRKGANFSVVYSSAGLSIGLYVLQRLIKERKPEKEKYSFI